MIFKGGRSKKVMRFLPRRTPATPFRVLSKEVKTVRVTLGRKVSNPLKVGLLILRSTLSRGHKGTTWKPGILYFSCQIILQ